MPLNTFYCLFGKYQSYYLSNYGILAINQAYQNIIKVFYCKCICLLYN